MVIRACVTRVVSTSSIECTENTIPVMMWYGGGRGNASILTGNDEVSSIGISINNDDYHSLTVVCQLCNWFCDLVTYCIESVFGYGQ